jgi:hypothetical protein
MKKPRMNTAPCSPIHRSIFSSPRTSQTKRQYRLTVRLLVPGARTWTAELLGLAPPVVGNEQCAVVLDQGELELVLRVLVDVLLVVGDDGFGNGLADGVDLRGVSTTGDADADVDISCPCLLVFYFSFPPLMQPGDFVCAYRTCQHRGSGWARRP